MGALTDKEFWGDVGNNAKDFLQSTSNNIAMQASVPVDAIAWALRKAGMPIPDAPLGGTDWMKNAGLLRDVPPSPASMAGEIVGGLAPTLAIEKAPKIAAGLNRMAENAMMPRTLNPQTGAIVWHGSPHQFNKFDSSKIGTGEGAQAYGHGIYTAENPAVAKQYASNLGITKKLSDGQFNPNGTPNRVYQAAFQIDAGVPRDEIIDGLKVLGHSNADALSIVRNAQKLFSDIGESGSHLYKVDLPDEHIAKMLDWDKPLSQQPQEMQRAWEKVMSGRIGRSADKSNHGYLSKREGQFADPTGKTLHDVIAEGLIGVGKPRPFAQVKEEATDFLRRQGIPGIRYLDGGSRGAGQGTSNYVVFPGNEDILTILERNGQPLGLMGVR